LAVAYLSHCSLGEGGTPSKFLQFVIALSFDAVCEADSLVRSRAALHEQAWFHSAEVEETIRTAPWQPAELGRLDCRKNFSYGAEWNGKVYATKQVRLVFVEEAAEIIVVTVYTYYF